jgi:hypothetical protein
VQGTVFTHTKQIQTSCSQTSDYDLISDGKCAQASQAGGQEISSKEIGTYPCPTLQEQDALIF